MLIIDLYIFNNFRKVIPAQESHLVCKARQESMSLTKKISH